MARPECLTLKWGTLKGWTGISASLPILKRYHDLGFTLTAMAQADTPEQKEILCELIDAVDGTIQNDWGGKKMTKEEAKKYVMEYRS